VRRAAPARRGRPLTRSGTLTATTRIKSVSRKVTKGRTAFRAVYDAVDARSGKRCEVVLRVGEYTWLPCWKPAPDRHHTKKPRRSFHDPRWIVALCRRHHEMCDAPYAKGRLLIHPNGDGTFRCDIVTAPSKFAYREAQ